MTPYSGAIAVILTMAAVNASAQQVDPAACPLHAAHTRQAQQSPKPTGHDKHAAMEARGGKAMGFEQSRASHHFRLLANGGTIEIHTNSAGDDATRQQVVAHLEAITRQFKKGDFSIPRETHGALPEGVDGMMQFKDEINYTFEAMENGGRVVMTTKNPSALASVHAFLRYQIREHRTGDPSTVVK
jgi:hypothetical protein